jgi:hypothetical protein
MRTTARLPLVLLLAFLAALVAGCGSDSDDSSASKTSGADRAASTKTDDAATEGQMATVDAKLKIELTNVGGKDLAGIPVPAGVKCTRSSPATCHGTLECPAATDDPDAIELCGWLASTGRQVLLAKDEPGQICTEQYGGPEVATVTGTIGDEQVDATFSRENGCAIGRFDEAAPLWTGDVPKAQGGGSTTTGGAASGSCPALDPDAPVSSDQADPAAGAADGVCASPATPAPPTSAPPVEPEIISDPPEAFGR